MISIILLSSRIIPGGIFLIFSVEVELMLIKLKGAIPEQELCSFLMLRASLLSNTF